MNSFQDKRGSGWRSGGPTGLQNQLAELSPRLVGSIPTRSRQLAIFLVVFFLIFPENVFGQDSEVELVPVVHLSVQSLDSQEKKVSATGAFIRSLILPGWGQSAAGSPGRGAFYFGVEGASMWMVLKTARTLNSAKRQLKILEDGARVELMTNSLQGSALEEAIKQDPAVIKGSALVEDRSQQREDWMAVSLFFLLFGAADAFVTAHLQDFPEALKPNVEASPELGIELGFSLPMTLFN